MRSWARRSNSSGSIGRTNAHPACRVGFFIAGTPLAWCSPSGFTRRASMTQRDTNINNLGGASEYPMGNDGDEAIRQLNSFLRGEISAAETYKMAIDKAAKSDDTAANMGLLREIQEEHGRAAQ